MSEGSEMSCGHAIIDGYYFNRVLSEAEMPRQVKPKAYAKLVKWYRSCRKGFNPGVM